MKSIALSSTIMILFVALTGCKERINTALREEVSRYTCEESQKAVLT